MDVFEPGSLPKSIDLEEYGHFLRRAHMLHFTSCDPIPSNQTNPVHGRGIRRILTEKIVVIPSLGFSATNGAPS